MSFSVDVPNGIVRVDYKYRKRVLIHLRSDAIKVNLIVLFRDEVVFADLKFLVDGTDHVPWEAWLGKQDVGIWFGQDINRKLDGLFASNGHKHVISCQFVRKISV